MSESEDQFWQMSLRRGMDDGRSCIILEIFNSKTGQNQAIHFSGSDFKHTPPNSHSILAKRWSAVLEKRLKKEGFDIPNMRERLLALIIEKWHLG